MGLTDRSDPATLMVAKLTIELAKQGQFSATSLRARVLKEMKPKGPSIRNRRSAAAFVFFCGPGIMSSRAEQYRELARECLELANKVPAKDRSTLLQMASEWERLADEQQWASDLRQKD